MFTHDPFRLVAALGLLFSGGQVFETVNKAASLRGDAAFSCAHAAPGSSRAWMTYARPPM
jgi:hypothetical protein